MPFLAGSGLEAELPDGPCSLHHCDPERHHHSPGWRKEGTEAKRRDSDPKVQPELSKTRGKCMCGTPEIAHPYTLTPICSLDLCQNAAPTLLGAKPDHL